MARHCPLLIQEVYFDWKQPVGHYPNLLKIEELDKADEEEVQRDVPREPFRYPRTLNLESDHAYDADDICPFLERCAGLTSLVVPSARTTEDRIRIATCIATYCPKLKRVFRWSRSKEATATESTFSAIVDTVPINSLATFEIVQHDNDDLKLCLAIPLHYESLTWIKFSNCRRLDSSVILGILRECSSMQHFEVNGDDRFLWDVSITLEDAVEKPWASRELQVLELAIDLGENMNEFYIGQRPETLSIWIQRERLATLEEFYVQIGALHQLTSLCLKVAVKPLAAGEGTEDAFEQLDHTLHTFP
ncbi:hypothetical protein BGX33_005326 [Mortierella sp. NVP41]|nr:hypothetical protein BGX33_005326 [Mortierella sp. NVP41]